MDGKFHGGGRRPECFYAALLSSLFSVSFAFGGGIDVGVWIVEDFFVVVM